jgi:peroxiredoxin
MSDRPITDFDTPLRTARLGAVRPGWRIPALDLGELVGGRVVRVRTELLFGGMRAVVIGAPGAFIPVCTERQVPDFAANAERLRAAGFKLLVCIAPNDPWVLARWAQEVDPARAIRFLSDGNLAFTRALGLTAREDSLFLGERCKRYTIVLDNCMIEKIRVEEQINDLTDAEADDVMLDA